MSNILKSAKLTAVKGLVALAITATPLCSQSQSSDYQQPTNKIENTPSAYSPLKLQKTESPRKSEFYFLGGQGTASSGGGNTEFYLEIGLREYITPNFSVGGAYINEGHPELIVGHRDGIALTAGYKIPIGEKLRLKVRAGPYFSMNTLPDSDNPEKELNEKGLGAVLSLGASYPLGNSGVNAIAQMNEIIGSGFNTFAVTAGLGVDLGGDSHARKYSTEQDNKNEISLMGGFKHYNKTRFKNLCWI